MECVGFKNPVLNGSNPIIQQENFLYQLQELSRRKIY